MKSLLTLSLCLFALAGSGAHAEDIEPTDNVYLPTNVATPPDSFASKGGDRVIAQKANAIAFGLASREWADLKKKEHIDGANVGEVHVAVKKGGYQLGVHFYESQLSFRSGGGTQNTPQLALIEVEVDSQGQFGKVSAYFARAMASPSFHR